MLLRMPLYKMPESDSKKTGIIVLIGSVIMIGSYFVSNQIHKYMTRPASIENSETQDFKSAANILEEALSKNLEAEEVLANSAILDVSEKRKAYGPGERYGPVQNIEESVVTKKLKIKEPPKLKISKKTPAIPPDRKTKIVIIIDDMGMDRKHSNQVIDIGAPLTLAFLPYAPQLKNITQRASAQGHELMIHMPMEPMKESLDPGPISIRVGMSEGEILKNLDKAFKSFDNYVGINNHMGSKVTQNEPILHLVMDQLAQRNLLFVDSKTISTSKAGAIAARHGLDYAERDVFLDH